ncbi:MAG: hypothetical protein Q4D61_07770 [Cardiobacteriaceae bacterium]|nr:hypothetical protein [Cardiobacteriaceae bacterium]
MITLYTFDYAPDVAIGLVRDIAGPPKNGIDNPLNKALYSKA